MYKGCSFAIKGYFISEGICTLSIKCCYILRTLETCAYHNSLWSFAFGNVCVFIDTFTASWQWHILWTFSLWSNYHLKAKALLAKIRKGLLFYDWESALS